MAGTPSPERLTAPLRQLWRITGAPRHLLILVIATTAMLNVLLLAGSLYLLLVYDSVLPSRSLPSLAALFLLVLFCYALQGLFDRLRSGMLADFAAAIDEVLSPQVQRATLEASLRGARISGDGLGAMRDLDHLRHFTATGAAVLIDLPWMLLFIAALFALHMWLGVTAVVGALGLLALAWFTDARTRAMSLSVADLTAHRNLRAAANLRHGELLAALGMRERMLARWQAVNAEYGTALARLNTAVGTLSGFSRVLRLVLQSSILTVGALLVINDRASAGIIFAASILVGRALAPADQLIANWRGLAAARDGLARIFALLSEVRPDTAVRTRLPLPRRELTVEALAAGPPGLPFLAIEGVQFALCAGQTCGVIGPSGAGKTTLARALTGIWPPARGAIRLDGATLDQWEPSERGRLIGYLPQQVELLDGTVAENIARFDGADDSAAVIAAAQAAGVHELIVGLDQGYDTPIRADSGMLSAGQRQRIGLARALYGEPFLVVLDEPNSNLDVAGERSLQAAIAGVRRRGGIAVIITHQLGVLTQVSHVLCLNAGRMEAFGPAPDVIQRLAPEPRSGDSSEAPQTEESPA